MSRRVLATGTPCPGYLARQSAFAGCLLAGLMVIAALARAGEVRSQMPPRTTAGAIAVANLDQQLAQARDEDARIELLLARARFLGDLDALDTALRLADATPAPDAGRLLLRARTRSAVHRFDEALADLDAAAEAGVDAARIAAIRAPILIATGRSLDALPALERAAATRPGYATSATLASAYAELGRYAEAARAYDAALGSLRTTSPFPYAWLYFARGRMWAEQAGDVPRGELDYGLALTYLPQFVVASIHVAELEVAHGRLDAAYARLTPIAAATADPEALALLALVARDVGDTGAAEAHLAAAHRRYLQLLEQHPLAFADHAAAFYLGQGADPARANALAQRNLANRPTARAFALALEADIALGGDGCALLQRMERAFAALPAAVRREWRRQAVAGIASPSCASQPAAQLSPHGVHRR